jgi:hypothetical protein
MIVLVGIAVILLLTLVLEPTAHPAQAPGWTGFVMGPSTRSTDRDDIRVASDLQVFR